MDSRWAIALDAVEARLRAGEVPTDGAFQAELRAFELQWQRAGATGPGKGAGVEPVTTDAVAEALRLFDAWQERTREACRSLE